MRTVTFAALVTMALLCVAPGAHITYSMSAHARAPHQARRVLSSVTIPARPGIVALVYQVGTFRLAVARNSASLGALLWQRVLPGRPASVEAPGPDGLFQVVVPDPSDRGARFVAFRLHDGLVSSAIDGAPSGLVSGDDGIRERPDRFTQRERDTQHAGSVRYRLANTFVWRGTAYRLSSTRRVPDYPSGASPLPNLTVRTQTGDVVLVRVQIADTPAKQELGLMNIKTLDPDSGMIFVWQSAVTESFWMENTYVPLSIAFLGQDGTVQEIQDMAPMTTNLHTPARPYWYALEVNQGFFARNGVSVGDRFRLHLS